MPLKSTFDSHCFYICHTFYLIMRRSYLLCCCFFPWLFSWQPIYFDISHLHFCLCDQCLSRAVPLLHSVYTCKFMSLIALLATKELKTLNKTMMDWLTSLYKSFLRYLRWRRAMMQKCFLSLLRCLPGTCNFNYPFTKLQGGLRAGQWAN